MPSFCCPVCNHAMRANDSDAGRKLPCPACGQRLQIPGAPPINRTVLGKIKAPATSPSPDSLIVETPVTGRRRRGSFLLAFIFGSLFVSTTMIVGVVIAWFMLGKPPLLRQQAVREDKATPAIASEASQPTAAAPPATSTRPVIATTVSTRTTEPTNRQVFIPPPQIIPPVRDDPQEDAPYRKLARNNFWQGAGVSHQRVKQIVAELGRWKGDNCIAVILSDGSYAVGFDIDLVAVLTKSPADILCREIAAFPLTESRSTDKLIEILAGELDKAATRLSRLNAIQEMKTHCLYLPRGEGMKFHEQETGKADNGDDPGREQMLPRRPR